MEIYMLNTILYNFLGIHFFITPNLFHILFGILQFGQHKYDFHYLLTFKSCKNVMIALTRRFAENKYEFYKWNAIRLGKGIFKSNQISKSSYTNPQNCHSTKGSHKSLNSLPFCDFKLGIFLVIFVCLQFWIFLLSWEISFLWNCIILFVHLGGTKD